MNSLQSKSLDTFVSIHLPVCQPGWGGVSEKGKIVEPEKCILRNCIMLVLGLEYIR